MSSVTISDVDQYLWSEKYRPKTVEDCILPESLKTTFQRFVEDKDSINLLLTGGPGCGKTTVAKALCEEMNVDYIVINGSMNGNIDTLRTTIQNFASCVSFSGNRKFVILDEADYLNAQSTQPALRNFMEEYSSNCGFILTCNYVNKVIDPLRSRCKIIDFRVSKREWQKIAVKFLKRVCAILDLENVEYNKEVVANVVANFYPDWRRVINELQGYATNGPIDTGILSDLNGDNFRVLVKILKEKKFVDMRKWVAENMDGDSVALFRKLYDTSTEYMKPDSIPQLVLTLAKYQDYASNVADQEINMVACLLEIMVDTQWL